MTSEESIDRPDPPGGPGKLPTLAIDWELYGRYLDDSGLAEADKRLLIETLWSIMVSFVDLGFRLSPIGESCGQAGPPDAIAGDAVPPVLHCRDTTTTQAFEGAAVDDPASSSGRGHDAG